MVDPEFALIGTSWLLVRLDDPTGLVGPTPSGGEVLKFDVDGVADNHQNAARVRFAASLLHFGPWANGAVGVVSTAPLPAPLTAEERRFLFSVLAGDASWTVMHQELTISKHAVGSATLAQTVTRRPRIPPR